MPAVRPAEGEPPGPPAVLDAERAHLHQSRKFLQLMRDDVLSLQALGGDPVSEQYLQAQLYHRAEALHDLPDTPLFFGRLDYGAGWEAIEASEATGPGRFHIGRRHVHDPGGSPVVIDWRAPVSRPFYRASRADPMGLDLRRRFGFSGGELTAYEDEWFTAAGPGSAAPPGEPVSRLLIQEIERPRSGPMRDIVATIQPEQDDIVRADVARTVCVQGAPGTGKTAVGLHRIAYLLYAYSERVARRGVLVIGPNRAFLGYIGNVLPALGEINVRQLTVTELAASVAVGGRDSLAAARVKGDARMAEVLRRALWSRLTEPPEPLTMTRGSRRWRVSAYDLAGLAAELRERGLRYGAGRDLLGHRIAHVILSQLEAAGETCDDRTHDAVRRARPVRAAVDAIWPRVDPVRLVFGLLSDVGALAAAAAGVLTGAEQDAVVWARPPRGPGSARWSPADAMLIDEARDLVERTPSLSHVVVDEAQDLSPMECRAIGRRCSTGAATVLGDLAQGTTPWATGSWAELLAHLGKPGAQVAVLGTGYRVPRQILDFASRLLSRIAPGLPPAASLREDAAALHVVAVAAGQLGARLAAVCAEAAADPGSVAVIAADQQISALSRELAAHRVLHRDLGDDPAGTGSRAGLVLVPVTLAKGLEFDHVIVVEPAAIAAAEARGLQRLYVALTRAVSRLTVLHAEPLPEALLNLEVPNSPDPVRGAGCGGILVNAHTLSSILSTRSNKVMTVEAQRMREATDVQLEYLEKLGEELARRGFGVRMELPPGRVPSLYVVNQNARALEEHVYAGCGSDGAWWFWWSWAERISAAQDLDAAASAVQHVLASHAAS
ncbi:MAG TPA: ATP-binding domain-containing protein [Streptosporangiaceae bacterium]